MVDLMTVIPIFVLYRAREDCPHYKSILTVTEGIYYIICGMNTTRILRALRFHKHFMKMEDEVKKCLANMSLIVVVMILFSKLTLLLHCMLICLLDSAVIQYLEPEQHFPFHTCKLSMVQ